MLESINYEHIIFSTISLIFRSFNILFLHYKVWGSVHLAYCSLAF